MARDGRNVPIGSPTKEQLQVKVQELTAKQELLRQEAYSYTVRQRLNFEHAARTYEQQARDVAQAEVSQAESMAQGHYHSTLDYFKRAANSVLDTQRTTLIHEGESALEVQRSQIVEEAKSYLVQQQQLAEHAFARQQSVFYEESETYRIHTEAQNARILSLWQELSDSYDQKVQWEKEAETILTSNKQVMQKLELELSQERLQIVTLKESQEKTEVATRQNQTSSEKMNERLTGTLRELQIETHLAEMSEKYQNKLKSEVETLESEVGELQSLLNRHKSQADREISKRQAASFRIHSQDRDEVNSSSSEPGESEDQFPNVDREICRPVGQREAENQADEEDISSISSAPSCWSHMSQMQADKPMHRSGDLQGRFAHMSQRESRDLQKGQNAF